MIDIADDPIVIKLIVHAKEHKNITWDELNEILPEKITSSETLMEEILELLEQEQIQIIEDTVEDSTILMMSWIPMISSLKRLN